MSYDPPTEEEMRQVRRRDGRRGGCGSPCCSEDSATHVHCGDPCSMAVTSLRWKRAGSPRARYDGDPGVTHRASVPTRFGDLSAPTMSITTLVVGGLGLVGLGFLFWRRSR